MVNLVVFDGESRIGLGMFPGRLAISRNTRPTGDDEEG